MFTLTLTCTLCGNVVCELEVESSATINFSQVLPLQEHLCPKSLYQEDLSKYRIPWSDNEPTVCKRPDNNE